MGLSKQNYTNRKYFYDRLLVSNINLSTLHLKAIKIAGFSDYFLKFKIFSDDFCLKLLFQGFFANYIKYIVYFFKHILNKKV